MRGFIDFIREQGIVGFAVGFILGGAVSKLVASLVSDVVNPLVGLVLGFAGDLSAASFQIGRAEVLWGRFLMNTIDFVVLAALVYFIVKGMRLDRLDKKKQ